MKRDSLNENFWNNRYLENDTGWDLGAISPAIKKWFDTKKNKDLQILIPGAGKGHEVKYGFHNGFNNIQYLDISNRAVALFKDNCPNFPKEQILISDFFDLKKDLFFDVGNYVHSLPLLVLLIEYPINNIPITWMNQLIVTLL